MAACSGRSYSRRPCHELKHGRARLVGSTGEGHTLDHEEYRDLMAATVAAVKGRIPVIAGIIVDSTRDAIRRAHKCIVRSTDLTNAVMVAIQRQDIIRQKLENVLLALMDLEAVHREMDLRPDGVDVARRIVAAHNATIELTTEALEVAVVAGLMQKAVRGEEYDLAPGYRFHGPDHGQALPQPRLCADKVTLGAQRARELDERSCRLWPVAAGALAGQRLFEQP